MRHALACILIVGILWSGSCFAQSQRDYSKMTAEELVALPRDEQMQAPVSTLSQVTEGSEEMYDVWIASTLQSLMYGGIDVDGIKSMIRKYQADVVY